MQINQLQKQNQEQINQIADAQISTLQSVLSERYHIIKPLGKGSQGAVYLAENIQNKQMVAIKQLQISSVKDWKQYDLFQREAEVLKRLNIPGIAKLHETIEILDSDAPMALIIQDYIAGEPLQRFINNGHRFQLDQIGCILLQLLDILQKLHESDPQVVHRDIKPSNILLNYVENNEQPEIHLIDFGAVSNPQVKGGGSTVVGTYGYMAPEQLMGNASTASDIYSLAIVAVYLLSGVPPESLDIQDFHILIDSHLQHLPYSITLFLRQMLEPRSEDRMTDYDKIRTFFQALISQEFDKIPCTNTIPTNKNYSLKDVYSYHQAGNIVLWQELSDKTPRHFSKMPSFLVNKFYTKYIIPLLCFLSYSFLFIILFVALVFLIIDGQDYGCIIYFFFITFGMLYFLILKFTGIKSLQPGKSLFFLRHARKSMATVIRIEYKTAFSDGMRFTDINSLTKTKYTPTWQITYRFNPPDDKSPDDLIRTVETHVEPDVKEGDLIPILYLIDNDGLNEHVYSTPYPIPVTDDYKLAED